MRRRRKNRKQVRVVIGLSICLLLIMTVGYAAFSTNLTLTAKGNIHNLTTVDKLKNNVVTEGDGLYVDTYEDGRYVYKGGDPDNYLKFGGNLYRIISLEKDGTLKIVKKDSIGAIIFDGVDNRYSENGYCSGMYKESYCGCNLWGSSTTMLDGLGNSVNVFPIAYGSATTSPIPDQEADINTYLNTSFYGSIPDSDKRYIVNHKFNVGKVARKSGASAEEALKQSIADEKTHLWIGKIGLIGVTDYVRGSSSEGCNIEKTYQGQCSGDTCECALNNFLFFDTNLIRTLSPLDGGSTGVDRCITALINPAVKGEIITNIASLTYGTRYYPSFYISASKFLGSGTASDPYIIKE